MRRHKKSLGDRYHIDVWPQMWLIHAYVENYLVLELKQHSLHINSVIIFMPWRTKVMEIFQLRHTLVGRTVKTIFFPRHQASRLYIFNIQFPIHSILLIRFEGCPHEHISASRLCRPFWFWPPFWNIANLHTVIISSYRRNTTDFTLTQYHPLTLRMKS